MVQHAQDGSPGCCIRSLPGLVCKLTVHSTSQPRARVDCKPSWQLSTLKAHYDAHYGINSVHAQTHPVVKRSLATVKSRIQHTCTHRFAYVYEGRGSVGGTQGREEQALVLGQGDTVAVSADAGGCGKRKSDVWCGAL